MKKWLTCITSLALCFSLGAVAQDHHATVQPDAVKWGPGPGAYPPGAQFAVLSGDPAKEGFYVVRLKVPAGYRIAPHTHPNDENVTVLSGSFGIGTGERFDSTKGATIKAGGYSRVGKGMSHYAWFSEDTVIQLHGQGPQGITYVNPADDPRKK
ncbi:MAG TPA: cupin domain-containing protein [Burkholderiales bacterium]|nr:cupin domain-containing protein [Burkholderiales bacterium]